MPSQSPEEILEYQIDKRLEEVQVINEAADETEVADWINNPLTLGLLKGIEAELLQYSLGFMTNTNSPELNEKIRYKIEVYGQIREYIKSGEDWLLKKEEEEKEDVESERTLRSGETEQDS